MTAVAPRRLFRLAAHRRLAAATVIGVGFAALLPDRFAMSLRALLGWDSGALVFLAAIGAMMAGATPGHMRRRAALQDEGRWAILFVVAAGAFFSLLALVAIQKQLKDPVAGQTALGLALIGGTILLSWLMLHTVLALHYAHEFYAPTGPLDAPAGGLAFPDEAAPDYWDFAYFSLVIGMTCQVSDVQVTSRAMRRLALAHGVISFVFNTIILALTINIIAGMI